MVNFHLKFKNLEKNNFLTGNCGASRPENNFPITVGTGWFDATVRNVNNTTNKTNKTII